MAEKEGFEPSWYVISTVAHEVTHWMEEKAKELYAQYDKMVMDALTSGGLSEADVIRRRLNLMQIAENKRAEKEHRKPREITDKEARREVIARASEDMLTLSEEGKKFFESLTESEQKQFVDKIQEVLQNIKDWIKSVLSKLTSDAPEAKDLRALAKDLDALSKMWDEMLRESAKVNAAMKKAGVNDKAIMESKVEAGTQKADIDTYAEEQYNNWESYELTDEFLAKVPYYDRHTFLRSLANKTSELKQGKRKNIVIRTAGHVYLYAATGYMNGSIENVYRPNEITNEEIKAWRYLNGSIDTSTTTPDSMAQSYESRRGRDDWDNVVNGHSGKTGQINDVDEQEQGSDPIGYIGESDGDFSTDEELIPGSFVYEDGHAFKVNDDGTTEDIQFSDIDDDIQTAINQSMTMAQAKDMIQRSFVSSMIEDFYDGKYKNGDEWLAGEGADEVGFYIENEYSIVQKYLNDIPGYIDGDILVQDVLNAYVNKTLTGKVKQSIQWMDLSKGVAVADKRFYSPKEIKNAKKKLEIAKQRIDKSNKAKVTKARAEILLYAHNKGAAETLGLTESELNKMLRQWGGYRAGARDISMRFNNNVATSNRWSGIENSTWLSSAQVSEKELSRLVKSVEGDSQGFERNYIVRTMLALDTHIDWSDLKFIFTGVVDPNRRSVRGTYSHRDKTIKANYHSPDTVAHEMGHALDHKWANDLGFSSTYVTLTEGRLNANLIKTEEGKIWYSHFQDFIKDLTDAADISSSYTMDAGEVFARFVSTFVQWVDQTATGRKNHSYINSGRNDKFNARHYISFVKLLQEKAMLDSKSISKKWDEMLRQSAKVNAAMKKAGINDKAIMESKEDVDTEYANIDNWIARYTPKQYNDYGWVAVNKVLTGKELKKLYSQFANIKLNKKYNFKNKLGEYLIPVGDKYDSYDHLVYIKGTNKHPIIRQVVEITEQYRKNAEDFIMEVMDYEATGNYYDAYEIVNSYEGAEVFNVHTALDYPSYSKLKNKGRGGQDDKRPHSDDRERNNGTRVSETRTGEVRSNDVGEVSYSDIDDEVDIYEVLGENKRLQKENEKLLEDFKRLKERLDLERKVTGGTTFNRNQLDAVAGHIRKLANSNYSKTELVNQLNDVYTYIVTSKELTWEDLYARLYGISQTVLKESRPYMVEENDYFKTVLKEIRTQKISLSDVQKQELESAYGTSWNRAVFGKLNVSNNATMSLDSQWSVWANEHPGLFDAETTEGDQIIRLLEIYDDVRDGSETFETLNNEDMTRWLANEIYNQYWNVSIFKSTADKYDKKIKLLNFDHRKAMKELRDNYEERLAKQKQADKSKYNEIIKNIRQRKEKEIQEVRKLGKKRMDKYRENAKRKTLIQSILSTTTSLNKKFVKSKFFIYTYYGLRRKLYSCRLYRCGLL